MLQFLRYLGQRVGGAIATVFAGAVAVFLIMKAAPGDPAVFVLGDFATQQSIAAFRAKHSLDQPVLVQLWLWLETVLAGNLGESVSLYAGRDIAQLIGQRMPGTAFLGIYALLLALVSSLALGTIAALQRGRTADVAVTMFAVVGISMPDFWLGYVLVLAFALTLGWLPAYGFTPPGESLTGALLTGLLPAIAIAAPLAAVFSRILRVSLLETVERDYVTAARSMGYNEAFIFINYVLRNALIPFVTIVGLQVRYLLGGVVVIERIFGVPGIGSLMVDAAFARDYAVVQACALTFLVIVLTVNLIVDLVCVLLDPRRSH
ncbi:MAG: ABC transporter permease [Alphaproteobacteria bacterium]|nr:ABC transporter permease [Alphaproteobacteria bacterium]